VRVTDQDAATTKSGGQGPNPLGVAGIALDRAVRLVPSMKWAVAAVGVAAALALITMFGTGAKLVIALPLVVGLMMLLVLFNRIAHFRAQLLVPALLVMWTMTVLFCGSMLLAFTGFAFGWPASIATALGSALVVPRPSQPAAMAAYTAVVSSLSRGSIPVDVWVRPDRALFVEGETIEVGYTVAEDAYVAVLVYSDDSTVKLIYPVDLEHGVLSKAHVETRVGSADDTYKIVVQAPFGVDVVQAIAFKSFDDLTGVVRQALGKRDGKHFQIDSRKLADGFRAKGLGRVETPDAGRGAWGDGHLLIHSSALR